MTRSTHLLAHTATSIPEKIGYRSVQCHLLATTAPAPSTLTRGLVERQRKVATGVSQCQAKDRLPLISTRSCDRAITRR